MYTRLSTWTNATDIDGGIDYLRSTALPICQQQRGYRELTGSVDRSTGTFGILSTWETEADREASEGTLGKSRDEASGIIGGSVRVEKFELLVAEVVTPPVPGSILMVTPISIDPAKIEENLAFFKEVVVPPVKAAPGFCALRNMVDRSTGEGYTSTIWVDRAAVDAQADGAAARRELARGRGVTFGDITFRELVLIDRS